MWQVATASRSAIVRQTRRVLNTGLAQHSPLEHRVSLSLCRASFGPCLNCRSAATASTTADGADSGSKSSGASAAPAATPATDDNASKPMGWGRFFMYISGGVTGVVFLFYYYKSGYSLHRTEVMMLERFRRLPVYWPPGPPAGEKNSNLDGEGLPPDIVDLFAAWFIATDLREAEGVTRDDVLELLREMGYPDDDKACKAFLERGEGLLEERRRMSGAGLQESLSLLAKFAAPTADSGTAARPPDAVADALKRRLAGVASMSAGLSALQQAMQAPSEVAMSGGSTQVQGLGVAAPFLAESAQPPPAASAAGSLPEAKSPEPEYPEEDLDESHQKMLEESHLARTEAVLLQKLERAGNLSPAEEARLQDVRQRRSLLLRS